MNLSDVMQEIGDRLKSIDGLRVHDFPADSVTPPAAIVSYPDTYSYDSTYGRGMDRITLPIFVVVGRVSARTTRVLLAQYTDGSGPASIKQALESGSYKAFDSIRVQSATFDTVVIADKNYLSAEFTCDVAGQGA